MLKKIILIATIFYSFYSLSAQGNTYLKGKILDSISVDSNSKETFTLYLPTNFASTKLSPIVFIFDPMGRGKNGITPFIKAAEQYGYILVCSNNAKNGPYENNFKITNRLFSSVFAEFNIDDQRIYAAGFSGGARLASAVAVLTKKIQGVIACGASFSKVQSHTPFSETFSFAGIIGNEDMNYYEMHQTRDLLNKFNISNELFTYEINHRWPSQDQILDAFDWLQLEAYKKGILKADLPTIHTIYEKYYTEAQKLSVQNKPYLSVEIFNRILKSIKNNLSLDSIKSITANLKGSKDYKKKRASLDRNFKEEIALTKLFSEKFYSDIKKDRPKIDWWKKEIKKLKKRLQNAENGENKMLQRMFYKTYALAIESVTIQHNKKAIFCYEICLTIYPKYAHLYYMQADNYLSENNKKMAITYISKLLETGYTNLEQIRNYEGFKPLRKHQKFIELTKE